jgi:PST family polysaccharide transporter
LATASVLSGFLVHDWRTNYFHLGSSGLVPFLITVSVMTILTSWWYARKIPVVEMVLGWRETLKNQGVNFFGLVFVASDLDGIYSYVFYKDFGVRQIGIGRCWFLSGAASLSSLYIGLF